MSEHVSDFKVAHTWRCITQVIPILVFLAACSTHSANPTPPQAQKPSFSVFSVITDTVKGSVKGAFQAAMSPLEDIGLKRPETPKQLKAIAENPYAVPEPPSCDAITTEMSALDTVLGPDTTGIVVTKKVDNSSLASSWNSAKNISWDNRDHYIEQGSSFTQKMAAETVRDRINSLIPYRSWIRWVSGAESRDRKVAAAFEAGKLRRAFLRGYSTSMHCYAQNDAAPSAKPVARAAPAKAHAATEEVASADEASVGDVSADDNSDSHKQ